MTQENEFQLISFFSGQGGFELAGDWMGWETITSCEINPFGRHILKYYWPGAYHHDDVKTINYEEVQKRIKPGARTVFVAGFPCQPFSAAGQRKGTEDERYGWPDCLTAVRKLRPCWCIFENVRGLTDWNDGMVFNQVQADLEAEGYEVTPFLLPACAVNAPHRRDRIWFIAYATGTRCEHGQIYNRGSEKAVRISEPAEPCNISKNRPTTHTNLSGCEREGTQSESEGEIRACCNGRQRLASDTNNNGLQGGREQDRPEAAGRQTVKRDASVQPGTWENFPTEPPLCSGNDGFPGELDGITFSKWRNESIKAAGNAIVPQVALQIYKAIEAYENLISNG